MCEMSTSVRSALKIISRDTLQSESHRSMAFARSRDEAARLLDAAAPWAWLESERLLGGCLCCRGFLFFPISVSHGGLTQKTTVFANKLYFRNKKMARLAHPKTSYD